MAEINTNQTNGHNTPRAALLTLGVKMEQLGIFTPVMEKVQIEQKQIKDSPGEKLLDALVAILAEAHGLVESNKRVRSDPALQRAFGRKRCADQSVISETLNAASEANVNQIHEAMQAIYQRHSQGYQHDYDQDWQLLDIDLSGQPCGQKAQFATKAYFATACYLAGLSADHKPEPEEILLAYVQVYDQRGGGVETAFREDKQGLGITKCNKKSFAAQALVTQLNALAHNLIVWFRAWLAQHCHKLWNLGIVRMIRDIFHMNAWVTLDEFESVLEITLTQFDPFAVEISDALPQLLLSAQVDVNLGET